VLLVAGIGASVAAAGLWRASVRAHERQSFQTRATNVSGRLEMQLRRDTDYVRTLRTLLTLQPGLTADEFRQWSVRLEEKGERGLFGALVVESVPASELASFLARRDAEPAFRNLVDGQVQPVARTGRAQYCLLAAGSEGLAHRPAFAAAITSILQEDWCDPESLLGEIRQHGTTRARFTREITESGQFAVYSVNNLAGDVTLAIEATAYRQGARLATPAQRRAAAVGWVLGSFDIPTLLSSARGASKGLGVALYHRNPGLTPEFMGGLGGSQAGAFSHTATLPLDGEWIIEVTGLPVGSGPSADIQALTVLLAGLLASALLAALVVVLARGRERALAMVREKTAQLEHQALHDALTGLPNRVLAFDRARQMLARARRRGQPVAALYVDVDGFKEVNDNFGHAAGDALLRAVAMRLQAVVRDSETAARLGGDEFVVFVEGTREDDGAPETAGPQADGPQGARPRAVAGIELVAERLLEALRAPWQADGDASQPREVPFTVSIGIACGTHTDVDALLREADIALYEAKARGKNRYVLFAAAMESAVRDRLALQADLGEALRRDELFLMYQPVFDLESERLVGVEALLRWRHPTRGVLLPAELMPAAEEADLVPALGRWVLREACAQAARWRARGHDVAMFVNVDAAHLEAADPAGDVQAALHAAGLDPGALTLELCEASVMRDSARCKRALKELKALGVRIAVDDFGAGYGALGDLPADALKIDRKLIAGVAGSQRTGRLIGALVALARTLGVETLAGGIEEHAQLEMLREEQCERGQGFLFAKPLAAEAVDALLEGRASAGRGNGRRSPGAPAQRLPA
jgi:predicted signal transduction protein with EAL and GGDEF domain